MKDSDASMAFALMQDLHQKLHAIEQQLVYLRPAAQQVTEIICKYIPIGHAPSQQSSVFHLASHSQLPSDFRASSNYSLRENRPANTAGFSSVDSQSQNSASPSYVDFCSRAELEVGLQYISLAEPNLVHRVSSPDVRAPDDVFEEVEAKSKERTSTTRIWSNFARRLSRMEQPKDSSNAKKSLDRIQDSVNRLAERPKELSMQFPLNRLRALRGSQARPNSVIQRRSIRNSRNYQNPESAPVNEESPKPGPDTLDFIQSTELPRSPRLIHDSFTSAPNGNQITVPKSPRTIHDSFGSAPYTNPVGIPKSPRSIHDTFGSLPKSPRSIHGSFTSMPSSMPVSRRPSNIAHQPPLVKDHSSPLKAAYIPSSQAASVSNTPRASMQLIPLVTFGDASRNITAKSLEIIELDESDQNAKSIGVLSDIQEIASETAPETSHLQELRKRLLGGDRQSAFASSASNFTQESSRPDIDSVIAAGPKVLRQNTLKSLVMKTALTATYTARGSVASLPELDLKKVMSETNVPGKLDMNEPQKQKKKFTGLSPLSLLNVNFEFAMAVLYTVTLWIIPLIVAFDVEIHWSFSLILSSFFLFDTIVEFNTLRSSHPEMTTIKASTIETWRWIYIQRYLLIDVISAVPFELLQVSNYKYLWLIRFLRFYKLPLILGASPKILALRKSLESALGIGETFSGIFPLMFALCAFLHIQACTIFLVGRLEGFSNSAIEAVANKSVWDQYVWAIFTAAGNTFPLTYKPLATSEQLTVLVFITVGAGLYASIVGTISSFAMGMDASGRLYKQKMDELREYMRWKDLSHTTRRKVMKYYEVKYRGKFFEEGTLLGEMNDSLRMEIAVHNCKELIQKVSFLRREMNDGKDELFVGRIATALSACYFVPGDVVFTQGEMGFDMFFILNGCVNIIVNGKRVVQFKDGAFFGELALIANIPRTATVQAASTSTMYRLTRPDFMSILSDFEDVRERIDIIYKERMEKVKLEEEAKAKMKLSP